MNIIIIQENGHHEANRNFRECFCLKRGFESHGASVTVWGKGHDNYEKTLVWEDYDLIFAIENWDWMPDLSQVSVPKFIWAIDAHCKGPKVYEQYGFDKILHASSAFVDTEDLWLPNCYDDTIIKPLDIDKSVELGFCGNDAGRLSIINWLMLNFGMKWDQMVLGDEMVRAVNSYKIHWNLNISVDVNYRNFETMGCRTLLLTSDHVDYGKLGINKENCLIYTGHEDLLTQLQRPADLSVAAKGYDLVKSRHTYRHRAQRIMEIYEERTK